MAEAAASGHTAFAMDLTPPPRGSDGQGFFSADLTDLEVLRKIIHQCEPDACLHLAGVAFVPAANTDPIGVIRVNITGTANLLEAFRSTMPKTRILVASSAQVYGQRPRPTPIKEEEPLTPDSLYGITKAAADDIARFYARQYGMAVMTARPSNHIGPGQSPNFVVPAFARQVRDIRRGISNAIRVGNLETQCDFTDVRDVVRAYRLLLEHGEAALAYNVASGRPTAISTILDQLCKLAGVNPRVEQDPALYRPFSTCPALDTTRLVAATGWQPQIPLPQTLKDILEAT
jgi:GDP-4-dehydro-6-deoxy-D-mannose reductase